MPTNKSDYDRTCKIQTLDKIDRIKSDRPDDVDCVNRLGYWLWVFDDSTPTDSFVSYLKSIGFKRVHKRSGYAHSCGRRSRRGRIHPREKYQVNGIE